MSKAAAARKKKKQTDPTMILAVVGAGMIALVLLSSGAVDSITGGGSLSVGSLDATSVVIYSHPECHYCNDAKAAFKEAEITAIVSARAHTHRSHTWRPGRRTTHLPPRPLRRRGTWRARAKAPCGRRCKTAQCRTARRRCSRRRSTA